MQFKQIVLVTLTGLCAMGSAKNVFDTDKFKAGAGGVALEKRGQGVEQPLFAPPVSDAEKYVIPEGEEPQKGPTLLTSTISINKDISVFASYVRDNVDVSTRFNSKKLQSIVFAPTDSGIETLPLKPWQFPTAVDETLGEEQVDKIISSNLNDFLFSHVVNGEVPFATLDEVKKGVLFVSENGKSVKLVNDEGEYYVTAVTNGQNQDWMKVSSVTTVDNGAILVIPRPLSLPSI